MGILAVSKLQLEWGLSYAGRSYDSKIDKLIYIGHNQNRSKFIKKLDPFSNTNQ